MKEFWDNLARAGTWHSYYDDEVNFQNYNFITRRRGVVRLLAEKDIWPNIRPRLWNRRLRAACLPTSGTIHRY